MNNIFKVIWNNATQTFVVTSELAKAKTQVSSHTRNSDKSTNFCNTFLKLNLITSGLLLVNGQAMAAGVFDTYGSGIEISTNGYYQAETAMVTDIAIGDSSSTQGGGKQ